MKLIEPCKDLLEDKSLSFKKKIAEIRKRCLQNGKSQGYDLDPDKLEEAYQGEVRLWKNGAPDQFDNNGDPNELIIWNSWAEIAKKIYGGDKAFMQMNKARIQAALDIKALLDLKDDYPYNRKTIAKVLGKSENTIINYQVHGKTTKRHGLVILASKMIGNERCSLGHDVRDFLNKIEDKQGIESDKD